MNTTFRDPVRGDAVDLGDLPTSLGFLLRLAGRLICLETGRVIAAGAPDDVTRNPDVIAAYLGVDDEEVDAVAEVTQ